MISAALEIRRAALQLPGAEQGYGINRESISFKIVHFIGLAGGPVNRRPASKYARQSHHHSYLTMTDTEPDPIDSPLSQTIVRNGKPVKLDIYNDTDGRSLLEAVDQYSNSTVWKESFPTEQDALDEGLRTIN